jgi:hypothetical protein
VQQAERHDNDEQKGEMVWSVLGQGQVPVTVSDSDHRQVNCRPIRACPALLTTDMLHAGGHLFYNLYRQGVFSEEVTRLYTAEIVSAVSHLHSLGIMHRELLGEVAHWLLSSKLAHACGEYSSCDGQACLPSCPHDSDSIRWGNSRLLAGMRPARIPSKQGR